MKENDYNNIIIYVLYAVIIANIYIICTQFILYCKLFDFIYIYNVITHFIAIILFYRMLKKNKESFYIFISLNLLNALIIRDLTGTEYYHHIFVAIVTIILLRILFFLKKNGISGWNLLK